MRQGWLERSWLRWAATSLAVLGWASVGRTADDEIAALRALLEQQSRALEQQGKQIEELKRQVDLAGKSDPTVPSKVEIDDSALKKIVADYLQENPGAGMPSGVQAGYSVAPLTPQITPGGFVIRSSPNPRYANWQDESRIPFELRIRGRMQIVYDGYKVTDNLNHQTNRPASQNANTTGFADFSQLEIKRGNIILEGTAFNPDLRYRINFNGFTRGLGGFQGNKVVQTLPVGGFAPNGQPVSPIGGGVAVSQGVTLFECFAAYDFHLDERQRPLPDGEIIYAPTLSLVGGKMKPFFGLSEFLGNQVEQFVEFSMTDFFFSADEDARLMGVGFQAKALQDRFFMQSLVTNGVDVFSPNNLMDQLPGFCSGWWYDVGGNWNEARKAWDLFGDCISDIDYSVRPVARFGSCVNLVPMGRRSLYGDLEQSRFFTMPGAPGGTRIINMLNGDLATPNGAHAVDRFDAYTYSAFVAGKFRGLSIYNEWWLRNLNNFHTTPNGLGNIIYSDTLGPRQTAANALFPANHGLIDYGMNVAVGYFIVPKRLEVAARWAWLSGQSGDINGDGTFHTMRIPGLVAPVHVVNGAFEHFYEADEYTVGVNYYFRRHLVKWQTDFGIYRGGNPDSPAAQSLAGFISGLDGFLVRSQLQLAF